MKGRKGFTLIELLAIIVILAIIAVITVPLILGIIDDAKKGVAESSAYGYKEAINRFYASELMRGSDYSLDDKIYTISELDTAGVSISGAAPDSNSWVNIVDNELVSACLQFGDYKVTISDGVVGSAVKGECVRPFIFIYSNKGDAQTKSFSDIEMGNYVTIGQEGFYVVNPDKNGKILLLAEYNLSNDNELGVYKQGTQDNFSITSFSDDFYWSGCPRPKYYTAGAKAYVYDENSNLYEPMEDYKDYLVEIGIPDLSTIRPMSMEEARDLILNENTATYNYPWVYNQIYWLGSDGGRGSLGYCSPNGNVWVLSSGSGLNAYPAGYSYGIRPLIEIPISMLELD